MNMHHLQPQHSQHPLQQPMQPMQQPQGHMQGPDFAAWGLDGATAQLGMQLGHSAVAAGQDYVQRNVGIIDSFL